MDAKRLTSVTSFRGPTRLGLFDLMLPGRATHSHVLCSPTTTAYVRDKHDLLRAIADDEFHELIARFHQVQDDDPVERVRGYCRAYIDHALANPELFKVMFLFRPRIGLVTETYLADDLASATEAFTLPAASLTDAIE